MNRSDFSSKSAVKILDIMRTSVCDGVSGVMHISSNTAGPTVGITVCSHGNEPAGLTAIDYLLNTLKLPENLLKGDVYLIVNNLDAAIESKRFISVDMNRLPANTPELEQVSEYEVRRARELLPIWRKFDVGLDIHSTSQDTSPMIISVGPVFHIELVKGFPIEIVISNIDRIQRGKPASSFYGAGNARVFGIEAGQHAADHAGRVASTCAEALLINLGMLDGQIRVHVPYREYRVIDSIVLPNGSYETPAEAFPNFQWIAKDTLVASGDGPDIRMPIAGHVVMHNGKVRPDDILNEALFITEPMRQW